MGYIGSVKVLLLVLIFVALFVFKFLMRKTIKAQSDIYQFNTEIAARILCSQVKKSFFYQKFWVEGIYKSRGAYYGWLNDQGSDALSVSMTPYRMPKPNKNFVIRSPQPTQYTVTIGKKVYYCPAERKPLTGLHDELIYGLKSSTKEEITAIFEELTKAAVIVEQGFPYFRE